MGAPYSNEYPCYRFNPVKGHVWPLFNRNVRLHRMAPQSGIEGGEQARGRRTVAIDHHARVMTGVAIVVAMVVSGVSGYTQGQWQAAITFALAFGAVGALIVAMFALLSGMLVNLVENHFKHVLEDTLQKLLGSTAEDAVMALRHENIGDMTLNEYEKINERGKGRF